MVEQSFTGLHLTKHYSMYFRKCQFCFPGPRLQVFDEIGTAVIDQAFSGYNATVFAYGQVRRSTTPSRSWACLWCSPPLALAPKQRPILLLVARFAGLKEGGSFPMYFRKPKLACNFLMAFEGRLLQNIILPGHRGLLRCHGVCSRMVPKPTQRNPSPACPSCAL